MKTQNNDGFAVRSYGRTELAREYCPQLTSGAAYRQLMRWIRLSPELSQALLSPDGKPEKTRTFTPSQVRLITYYLGEP